MGQRMPGYARKEIVREREIGVYHTWSRCVQRAFLCGLDPEIDIDFDDYRRDWIKSLLEYQARVFAVDVGNYSVLSNHQHLIVRTRSDNRHFSNLIGEKPSMRKLVGDFPPCGSYSGHEL